MNVHCFLIAIVLSGAAACLQAQAPASTTAAPGNTIWQLSGTSGENTKMGATSARELDIAPWSIFPRPEPYAQAVSLAETSAFGAKSASLYNPLPIATFISPNFSTVGISGTFDLSGTGFIPASVVLVDDVAVTTQFVSTTLIRFTFTPASTNAVTIKVRNPAPGGGTTAGRLLAVKPAVTVTVSPKNLSVMSGASMTFVAFVVNTDNRQVNWFVNDVPGGNATVGTITAAGVYTAPAAAPNPATVTVKASSQVQPTAFGTAPVNILNPIPVVTSLIPSTLQLGFQQEVRVIGSGFIPTSRIRVSGTELATTFVSPSELRATINPTPVVGGALAVVVSNPAPGAAVSTATALPVKVANEKMSYSAASRFLEQATWGPSPASIAELQSIGVDAWLAAQFALPASPLPDAADEAEGLNRLQNAFLVNGLRGPDQLRQRVAFALSQIVVATAPSHYQVVPYQRLIADNAFGNYLDLLKAVTLNPTMGRFLTLAYNDKSYPLLNLTPNENFARELLQLFTIGLYELNPDGSQKLENGAPKAAYSEDTVKAFARALTGWTFPPKPGVASVWLNPMYFTGQMVAFEDHHDTGSQLLLNGETLPAGGTARQHLDGALQNAFNHPNVGSFVGFRLIQHLVTSNPSPAYVARVAAVFNNSNGVRGDLKAVVRAILLDPESGNSAVYGPASLPAPELSPSQGQLREPAVFMLGVLRALNSSVIGDVNIAWQAQGMGQSLMAPPSVFGYFSPSYTAPGSTLLAPEFQLMNATSAITRANFVWYSVLDVSSSGLKPDLANLIEMAGNKPALADAVGMAYLRGAMPSEMRASILRMMDAVPDARNRTNFALWLAATSSVYQVKR